MILSSRWRVESLLWGFLFITFFLRPSFLLVWLKSLFSYADAALHGYTSILPAHYSLGAPPWQFNSAEAFVISIGDQSAFAVQISQ